jgi:hypothetical protein
MRVSVRERGRFASTCGLRKVAGSPGGRYEFVIVDSAGSPLSHLTEWYRLRKQPGGNGTRRTYLNFLLPFFAYVLKKQSAWNGEPEHIRSLVKAFLRDEVACRVAPDRDAEGYSMQLSGASPLAQSSLRVLCAALRDFYVVMADAGLYAYSNPMRSELLSACSRACWHSRRNSGREQEAPHRLFSSETRTPLEACPRPGARTGAPARARCHSLYDPTGQNTARQGDSDAA